MINIGPLNPAMVVPKPKKTSSDTPASATTDINKDGSHLVQQPAKQNKQKDRRKRDRREHHEKVLIERRVSCDRRSDAGKPSIDIKI